MTRSAGERGASKWPIASTPTAACIPSALSLGTAWLAVASAPPRWRRSAPSLPSDRSRKEAPFSTVQRRDGVSRHGLPAALTSALYVMFWWRFAASVERPRVPTPPNNPEEVPSCPVRTGRSSYPVATSTVSVAANRSHWRSSVATGPTPMATPRSARIARKRAARPHSSAWRS